jgi:hypothetical protein
MRKAVGILAASGRRGREAIAVVGMLAGCAAAAADDAVSFEKQVLTDRFHAEAAGIGDIDADGHPDVVYGPFWYAGPTFTERFEIYQAQDFDPNAYSDNFMTAVADVDTDGRLDVLVNEWPGKAVHWFRNPGGHGTTWAKHLVHPTVDNESPNWLDASGDGEAELVFHTGENRHRTVGLHTLLGPGALGPVSARPRRGRRQRRRPSRPASQRWLVGAAGGGIRRPNASRVDEARGGLRQGGRTDARL